jgi:uncharacterized protein (TIGR02246 family)
MDANMLKAWVDRYQEAWRTDDTDILRQLFTPDAVYLPGPFEEPWRGIDEIVKGWLEIGDSEEQWEFKYGVVAVTTEVAVIQGWTTYKGRAGRPDRDYSNIWLIWFAPEGRAKEFREWWVERPRD